METADHDFGFCNDLGIDILKTVWSNLNENQIDDKMNSHFSSLRSMEFHM